MAHSNIFQISSKPIGRGHWTVADDYVDTGFVGEIADYVDDLTEEERLGCLEWCEKYDIAPGIEVDAKAETIKIVSKEEYFREKWKKTAAAAMKLAEMPLKEFATSEAQEALDDIGYYGNSRHDLYADAPDIWGFCPFDEFVRNVNDGDVFYIGGIVDYHW